MEDLLGYRDWKLGLVQALDAKLPENPIPEPGTSIFIILGLTGILAFAKRKINV